MIFWILVLLFVIIPLLVFAVGVKNNEWEFKYYLNETIVFVKKCFQRD